METNMNKNTIRTLIATTMTSALLAAPMVTAAPADAAPKASKSISVIKKQCAKKHPHSSKRKKVCINKAKKTTKKTTKKSAPAKKNKYAKFPYNSPSNPTLVKVTCTKVSNTKYVVNAYVSVTGGRYASLGDYWDSTRPVNNFNGDTVVFKSNDYNTTSDPTSIWIADNEVTLTTLGLIAPITKPGMMHDYARERVLEFEHTIFHSQIPTCKAG